MNEQFRWLSQLLNNHQIRYWADSGTLLGLVRNGDLLGHDKDIDLGMWITDVDKLQTILPMLDSAGYDVRYKYYRRLLFKVTFTQKKTVRDRVNRLLGRGWHPSVLPVHIHVFHPYGEHAWSPQDFSEQPGKSPLSGRARADSLVVRAYAHSSLAKRFIKQGKCLFPLHMRARLWPFNRISTIITWWIPRRFFDQLDFNEELQVWTPAYCHEYLQLRYGDWRVPTRNWFYYRDDPAVRLAFPEKLVGEELFRNTHRKPS